MFYAKHLADTERLSRCRSFFGIAVAWLFLNTLQPAGSQTPLTGILLPDSRPPSNSNRSTSSSPTETAAEKLAKARADLAVQSATPEGSLQRTLLNRLVRLYEQQISCAAELEALKDQTAQVTREAAAWTGFAEAPPYSIFLTDELREAIRVERLEIARGESALLILTQLNDEYRRSLAQSEEKIRRLNDQLESARDNGERTRQRDTERLRSQIAVAALGVLDLERQVRQVRLAGSRIRLDLLEKKLAIAGPGAAFTEADLQKVRAAFDSEQ